MQFRSTAPRRLGSFTPAERRVIKTYRTPREVQRWLNRLPYNSEPDGPTQRSFREVVRLHTAHCLEGALAAAVILEQHGYPPRVLSFESIDQLDHVIYVYQRNGLLGLDSTIPRPGAARPQAGVQDGAGPGAQLRRSRTSTSRAR